MRLRTDDIGYIAVTSNTVEMQYTDKPQYKLYTIIMNTVLEVTRAAAQR